MQQCGKHRCLVIILCATMWQTQVPLQKYGNYECLANNVQHDEPNCIVNMCASATTQHKDALPILIMSNMTLFTLCATKYRSCATPWYALTFVNNYVQLQLPGRQILISLAAFNNENTAKHQYTINPNYARVGELCIIIIITMAKSLH